MDAKPWQRIIADIEEQLENGGSGQVEYVTFDEQTIKVSKTALELLDMFDAGIQVFFIATSDVWNTLDRISVCLLKLNSFDENENSQFEAVFSCVVPSFYYDDNWSEYVANVVMVKMTVMENGDVGQFEVNQLYPME